MLIKVKNLKTVLKKFLKPQKSVSSNEVANDFKSLKLDEDIRETLNDDINLIQPDSPSSNKAEKLFEQGQLDMKNPNQQAPHKFIKIHSKNIFIFNMIHFISFECRMIRLILENFILFFL